MSGSRPTVADEESVRSICEAGAELIARRGWALEQLPNTLIWKTRLAGAAEP